MKQNIFNYPIQIFMLAFMLFGLAAYSQQTLKGIVIDNETKEGLIGASIQIAGSDIGTATNIQSEFELNSKKAFDKIIISYTGYTTKEVGVNSDYLIIALERTTLELDQTIVTASRDEQESV